MRQQFQKLPPIKWWPQGCWSKSNELKVKQINKGNLFVYKNERGIKRVKCAINMFTILKWDCLFPSTFFLWICSASCNTWFYIIDDYAREKWLIRYGLLDLFCIVFWMSSSLPLVIGTHTCRHIFQMDPYLNLKTATITAWGLNGNIAIILTLLASLRSFVPSCCWWFTTASVNAFFQWSCYAACKNYTNTA